MLCSVLVTVLESLQRRSWAPYRRTCSGHRMYPCTLPWVATCTECSNAADRGVRPGWTSLCAGLERDADECKSAVSSPCGCARGMRRRCTQLALRRVGSTSTWDGLSPQPRRDVCPVPGRHHGPAQGALGCLGGSRRAQARVGRRQPRTSSAGVNESRATALEANLDVVLLLARAQQADAESWLEGAAPVSGSAGLRVLTRASAKRWPALASRLENSP